MEARNTRTSRTRFLSVVISLVVIGLFVLGLVFMSIANAQPYIPGGPDTPVGEFFWTGALVLLGAGMLAGIGAVVIAIVIALHRQSRQKQPSSHEQA